MFHDMWGWGGMWMGLIWLVILGLIVWGVISFASSNRGASTGTSRESALEILKKRYARGEISDEEFEEKKKRLGE